MKKIKSIILIASLIMACNMVTFAADESGQSNGGTVSVDLSMYKEGDVIPAEIYPEGHFPTIIDKGARSVSTSTYTYSLSAKDSKKNYQCSNLRYKHTTTPMYLKMTSGAYKVHFQGTGQNLAGNWTTSGSAYLTKGQHSYVTTYLFENGFNEKVGFEATPAVAKTFKATILWSPDVVR